MGRKDGSKQVNIVFTEEEFSAFKAYCNEKGISMTALLKKGINSIQLEDYKLSIPEQADAINEFAMYQNRMMDAYKRALDYSVNAYEIASNEVRSQLDSLKALTESHIQQSQTIERMSAENVELKADIKDKTEELNLLKKELVDLRKKSSECDALKEKVSELTQTIADERALHAAEIKHLRDEEFQKLLDVISVRKINE